MSLDPNADWLAVWRPRNPATAASSTSCCSSSSSSPLPTLQQVSEESHDEQQQLIGIHEQHGQCLVEFLRHYETLIVYLGYSMWRKMIVFLHDREFKPPLTLPVREMKQPTQLGVMGSLYKLPLVFEGVGEQHGEQQGRMMLPVFLQERRPLTGAEISARYPKAILRDFSAFFLWLIRTHQYDVIACMVTELQLEIENTMDWQFNAHAGPTLLHLACECSCSVAFARFLLQQNSALVNVVPPPLFSASKGGTLSLVRFFVERNEFCGSSQSTTSTSTQGNRKTEFSTPESWRDEERGLTPEQAAHGELKRSDALLRPRMSDPARVNLEILTTEPNSLFYRSSQNNRDETILHSAAENPRHQVAEFILAAWGIVAMELTQRRKFVDDQEKAMSHAQGKEADAQEGGALPSSSVLLAKWVNEGNLDKPIHTAAVLATSNSIDLLLRHGADIEATNTVGVTPLHIAATFGRLEVTKCLLAHGADILAKSRRGRTARFLAERSFHPDVEQLLGEAEEKQQAMKK